MEIRTLGKGRGYKVPAVGMGTVGEPLTYMAMLAIKNCANVLSIGLLPRISIFYDFFAYVRPRLSIP